MAKKVKLPPIPQTKKAKETIKTEMGAFRKGELHSGSKKGPVVKSRKQAIAISLAKARKGK